MTTDQPRRWDHTGLEQPTYAGPPPSVMLYPQAITTPRRVWELPLAILLWTYIVLGVLFVLLLIAGYGS
jgi:hypothetical protein